MTSKPILEVNKSSLYVWKLNVKKKMTTLIIFILYYVLSLFVEYVS